MLPQLSKEEEICEYLSLLIMGFQQSELCFPAGILVLLHYLRVLLCKMMLCVFLLQAVFVVVVVASVIFRQFFINYWERCCNGDSISREGFLSWSKYHWGPFSSWGQTTFPTSDRTDALNHFMHFPDRKMRFNCSKHPAPEDTSLSVSCAICSLQAQAPESCSRNTFLGTTFTLRKLRFAPFSAG